MKRAAAAAAATAIAVASAGACFAADPVEVLPEAMFATGNGRADAGKKGAAVSMTNVQGQKVDLGAFAHCGKILTD